MIQPISSVSKDYLSQRKDNDKKKDKKKEKKNNKQFDAVILSNHDTPIVGCTYNNKGQLL
jgi:hypothetical protein